MLGIDKIKEMFDQTFKAMDAMDTFRAKAIDVMGQNNTIIREEITHAAGARTPQGLTQAQLTSMIRETGREPVERDPLYRPVVAREEAAA